VKALVITIKDNPKSVDVARRCIQSGKKFGVHVEIKPAVTPKSNPEKIAQAEGINYDKFKNNKFSRFENCLAAFLSHYSCWKKAIEIKDRVLVLEHDAVFMGPLTDELSEHHLLSIGYPSYGQYKVPKNNGVYHTFSKQGGYLPGAHAYIVSPGAAQKLIEVAKTSAEPTDIFLNNKNFPFLRERYPWLVKADDSFSTIQNEEGCKAKHNYKKGIDII